MTNINVKMRFRTGNECDLLNAPKPICAAMALGRSFRGWGSSSAMCVTESGVPMVNAPLRMPVRNATPSDHPVAFCQSVKTKEAEAWVLAVASTCSAN
jgi:hypothetical protein